MTASFAFSRESKYSELNVEETGGVSKKRIDAIVYVINSGGGQAS